MNVGDLFVLFLVRDLFVEVGDFFLEHLWIGLLFLIVTFFSFFVTAVVIGFFSGLFKILNGDVEL